MSTERYKTYPFLDQEQIDDLNQAVKDIQKTIESLQTLYDNYGGAYYEDLITEATSINNNLYSFLNP